MVYCVDFDDTLCVDNKPNLALISNLRALQMRGNAIVLFTSRTGHRLNEAVQFCGKHGLRFNNVIGGKPLADVYIDDKAINPNGGVLIGG